MPGGDWIETCLKMRPGGGSFVGRLPRIAVLVFHCEAADALPEDFIDIDSTNLPRFAQIYLKRRLLHAIVGRPARLRSVIHCLVGAELRLVRMDI